jgi:hypothetical protein
VADIDATDEPQQPRLFDVDESRDDDERIYLLPTPRASDANGPGEHGDGGMDLRTLVVRLGPSPWPWPDDDAEKQ